MQPLNGDCGLIVFPHREKSSTQNGSSSKVMSSVYTTINFYNFKALEKT